MAQVTLKNLADKLGKSTLDVLQLIRSNNVSYERKDGNIFLDENCLSQQATQSVLTDVLSKEDDIPEIFPLYGTDVIVPEAKKISEQKRTNRIRVWVDFDAKENIERKLGKRYTKDKNYVAIPIASDLATSYQGEELISLLNSFLPDTPDKDNQWIKDTAVNYSRLSLEEKIRLRRLLRKNQRLINTAYELRNDAGIFSLTMCLEHERRPLIESLQDYYRSFTEAILVYQKLDDGLRERIFRLHNESSTDYEFVLALSNETFDLMRGISDRRSSNRSLVNTIAFALKDENENVDLVEKTRSMEWAQISLEEMLDYKSAKPEDFSAFVQDVLGKIKIEEFDVADFIKQTSNPEFFDKWRAKYGNKVMPYGLFVKYMVASLYLADKKEHARTLANNISNESADQLNYIIGQNGRTLLYDLLARKNLHDATSDLIRHWDSYKRKLLAQGCSRLRSRRYPPDQESLRFLKDIVDQIENKPMQESVDEIVKDFQSIEEPNFVGLYDYPNKRAWRQKWLSFIADYVRKNNLNPRDLKVLCLPGPEALEIKEVYDRLGIPRQNVTGVEINKKRFEYLQTQVHGARLFNDDILNYLRKTNDKFDIVMLDMDGFLDKHMFQVLQKLFSRGLVNKSAVFGTNFFTTREGEEQKEFYSKPLRAELAELLTDDELKEWDKPEELKQALGCEYNGVSIDSLRKLRDYGITGMIVKTLLGRQLTESNPAYSLLPEHQRCKKAEDMLASDGLLRTLIYNDHMRSHLHYFLRQVGLSELTQVVELYFSKAYFIEHAERYQYETQSAGHVMFYSDFFELDQHEEVFRPFDALMRRLVDKRKDIIQLYGQGTPKRAKRIKRLMDSVEDFKEKISPLHYKFTVTNGWLPDREVITS